MEPAGIALAAFSALKEVYLLTKFVLRVISSAIRHKAEQTRLHLQFRHEILFLKSFCYLLMKSDNTVVNDDQLDLAWLKHIYSILEQLRAAYGDYAKLAAAKDIEYQEHSPYYPSATIASTRIEFSLFTSDHPTDLPQAENHNNEASWLRELSEKVKDMDWRWSLFQKRKLEEVLADFKIWNGMLKELVPITLAAEHSVDGVSPSTPLCKQATETDVARLGLTAHTQLRQLNIGPSPGNVDLFLTNAWLETPEEVPLPPLSFGVLQQTQSRRENVIVEYKPIVEYVKKFAHGNSKPALTSSQTNNVVSRLANLLRLAGNSGLRTLPFLGYLEKDSIQPPTYAFIFGYPDRALESPPISLHSVITAAIDDDLYLHNRFDIAHKIAKAIWTFHTDEWVHKSIRSQSVVFFRGRSGAVMYQAPFLVNFEYSRPADGATVFTWDEDDEKNVYRHPDRQGPPLRSFNKTHDIYALGVVLLEIGLWQTAAHVREQAPMKLGSSTRFNRYELTDSFVTVAKQELPRLMGLPYRNAVLTCLMGDFSCRVHEKSFGMEFYQKVVQNLDIRSLAATAEPVEG